MSRNDIPTGIEQVLLRLLPPPLRSEHSEEIREHMAWLRSTQLKRMGPFRFWLFVWGDFLRVAVSGRPALRKGLSAAALLVAALLLVPASDDGPSLPDVDLSVMVTSADGMPGRFSASLSGGELAWRDANGDWRAIEKRAELDLPTELLLRGAETRLRLAHASRSAEVELQAVTSDGGATLFASGERLVLQRTKTSIGVRTWDWPL